MILEDADGDGNYEQHKDFVSGLNIATSVALGRGGVWVLQSPYLLFYPDRNRDDVPDDDPEVHLTGFNLEDTHSLATSLHWGPDGWLYGATGSTTTLNIQGKVLLGQGIWRYHPDTRKFEVFAEGGGNTVSFEFDKYGRAFSGTNNAQTRGPHYKQGATYKKNWSKHGPAMSPFIFGFFPHMAHKGYGIRFSQAFMLYEGAVLPGMDGQAISGMALTNRVQASRVIAESSTFRTEDTVTILLSEDRRFRPVDVEQGPDGCVYIADWHDIRIGHLDPVDTWDKSTGRIHRLKPAGMRPAAPFDLRRLADRELIGLLTHPNRWQWEQARLLLAERPGQALEGELRAILERDTASAALESFWILNLRGRFNTALARQALHHANPHVRLWAIRLLGDENYLSPELQADVVALARTEPNPEVRSQLASTVARLPAAQALPIVRRMLERSEDVDDEHIPLQLWWALESKVADELPALMAMLKEPAVWNTAIFSRHLARRLGQRFTFDQGPHRYYSLNQGVYSTWLVDRDEAYLAHNLETAAQLLALAPNPLQVDAVVSGMSEGLAGRQVARLPDAMRTQLDRLWSIRPHTTSLIVLAARLGHPEAVSAALAMMAVGDRPAPEQQQLIEFFGATGLPKALPLLSEMMRKERNSKRARVLPDALDGFEQPGAAETVMDAYPRLTLQLRSVAERMLSEKPGWARAMLARMDRGAFDPGVLNESSRASIRGFGDPALTALLERYLARRTEDPAERLGRELFAHGRETYTAICSVCHQTNGEGLIGMAPSLVASDWVQKGEEVLVRIVLHGKQREGRGFVMPPMGFLNDRQIAGVLTYVQREFGNKPAAVLPEKVTPIRQATMGRDQPWLDKDLADFAQ